MYAVPVSTTAGAQASTAATGGSVLFNARRVTRTSETIVSAIPTGPYHEPMLEADDAPRAGSRAVASPYPTKVQPCQYTECSARSSVGTATGSKVRAVAPRTTSAGHRSARPPTATTPAARGYTARSLPLPGASNVSTA